MSTYLIVGGSSGIGRKLVDRLLAKNHQVIVWSREKRDLPDHESLQFHSVDVTGEELPTDSIPSTLDGLVYCPGTIDLKSFRSLKPDLFRQSFEINVIGAARCIQAAERPLKKSEGSSSIVLFSTVAVSKGMPFHAAVASAKGAVEGLTRSLAAEFAPQVRVNAIAPSLTDTPLAGGLLKTDEKRQAGADRHPLKRIGTAEDMATMADFLLGDESVFITAQIIGIDGGLANL
ncbi:MAG: SDR family oxidoreductase [Bacteroidota bacterium]